MTIEISHKDEWIKFFRDNGFNCFPIPVNQKKGDYRYDASRTKQNQPISDKENYGILPILGKGNALIDIDNKERYRKFAESVIKEGYVVCETGRGWHIPVIGLTGIIKKVFLFDYKFQPNDSIIEIQSPDQYCVGIGSKIFHDKLEKMITYESKGSQKIWDAKGKDFHDFVDGLCKNLDVEGRKKKNAGSYKYLRDQFIKGEIPKKEQSNNYFHQAGIQCLTDELTIEQALEKIRPIYDKWAESEYYSNRPWSNIEAKVNDVYENHQPITRGRPKKKDKDEIDRVEIALEILATREIFADVETHDIYENKNGFLERINNSLKQELFEKHPELEKADQDSILFKLESGAEPIPPTNKDLTVFKNGVFDRTAHTTIETDELADMGFKEYNYLPKTKANEPKKFMKILYDNIPIEHQKRINAGLKAIFRNRVDSKISVIYGRSGAGKSTPLNILCSVLGDEYAYVVELNQFLEDRATRAHIKGKRLLVFQDLPKEWKDFTIIKTITGELKTNVRGFQKDNDVFDNKLKIWASGNYLTKIPEEEKDAMYTRRLSLIHNTRTEAYNEDSEFAERIIKNEGEKIISWIINLSDEECKYENKATIQDEWESISSPEIAYLEANWKPCAYEERKTVIEIVNQCLLMTGHRVEIDQMIKSMKSLGYGIKNNIISNIEVKPKLV